MWLSRFSCLSTATLVLLLTIITNTQAVYDKYRVSHTQNRGDIPEIPQYGTGPLEEEAEEEEEEEEEEDPFFVFDWDQEEEDFDEEFGEEDEEWDEEDEEELEEEMYKNRNPGRLWHDWLSKTEQLGRGRSRGGYRGQVDMSPFFQVNWDLRLMIGDKWWEGPNVCQRMEESEENVTSKSPGSHINRHHMMSSSVCDDTGTVYKCTSEVKLPTVTRQASLIYECCHGYQREQGVIGCTKELQLATTMETLKSLKANDMIEALEGVSLDQLLNDGNYTIFAPSSGILGKFKPSQATDNTVVIVTPDLVDIAREFEETVSSHVVEGFVKTTQLEDEELVPTLSSGDNIRINIYETPKRLLTANCRPVTSSDNVAINGVVHIVDGVLSPVKDSIAGIVSKNPDLSLLKTLIGRSGVLSLLKRDGQMTMLAPSNTAFSRLDPYVKDKLLSGEMCLQEVVRNHLLPNVICSSILDGHLLTINILNKYLAVKRQQDKLFVEGAQILETDIMATNGVVHIIDDVMIPEDAMTMPEAIRNIKSTKMSDLITRAGLTDEFTRLSDFTALVPSDDAFERMSHASLSAIKNDPAWLKEVLSHHILNSTLEYDDLTDNNHYITMAERQVLAKSYRQHPFGRHQVKTIQCAMIQKANVGTCGGTIHVIDRVLIPPKEDVLSALEDHENFSILLEMINKTDLGEELLKLKTFTLFAPTDEAFGKMDQEIIDFMMENPDKLADFLKHHITKETICCSGIHETGFMLLSRSKITLGGDYVTTRRHGNTVSVNRVPIDKCDMMASSGVIHAIDDPLPEAVRRHVTAHMKKPTPKNRLVTRFQNFMEHLDNGITNIREDHYLTQLDTYMDKLMDHVFGHRRKDRKNHGPSANQTMRVHAHRDQGVPRGRLQRQPRFDRHHHGRDAAVRADRRHGPRRNSQPGKVVDKIKEHMLRRQHRPDKHGGARHHN